MNKRYCLVQLFIIGLALLSGCITTGEELEGRIPTLVIDWVEHPINTTNQINISDISDVPVLGSTVMDIIEAIPDGDTHSEQTITQTEWHQIERRFERLNLKPSNKSPSSWSLCIDSIPFWIELVYILAHKIQ